MPLIIVRNDITKMKVDAIVNAANTSLLGGGGVDGAIHRAAGPRLLKECETLNGCETGKAKITKGYNLPCKYVIHTVGPVWRGGDNGEAELLKSCYQSSLQLAKENKIGSIAFPLISTGVYSYPKEDAFNIASEAIKDFLSANDMTVYIVVFDNKSFSISKKLFEDVYQYIDNNYVDQSISKYKRRFPQSEAIYSEEESVALSVAEYAATPMPGRSLDDILTDVEDTFSQRLLKLIDIKNKTDVEVYKKANIDRKLFSKIRSNNDYKPSKSTVLSFCIALELSLDETKDLLMTAGFALSRSSKFDLIVEYFITNEIYNIFEVNEMLFAFEQNLLGV